MGTPELILASGSPRRRELLATLAEEFRVELRPINEDPLPGEQPHDLALRLAREKGAQLATEFPDSIVLSGDTVVAQRESGVWQLYGKPANHEQAVRMLQKLSGGTHSVITGISFGYQGRAESFVDEALVTFRVISNLEIESYVQSGEPFDKAGGYAIQGGAKGFVSQLKGDIETVIGLPTAPIRMHLTRYGFPVKPIANV